MTESFPPLTLHPVADSGHRWSGLLIQCDAGGPLTPVLMRLFGEFGLLDALGHLPCILPPMDIAGLDPQIADLLPAEQLALRIPAAQCVDPAQTERLVALRVQGFQLLADGLPPDGATLPPCVGALALDFGTALDPAAAAGWMARINGPHLALRVDDISGFRDARQTGFRWIAGNYPLQPQPAPASTQPGRAVMLKLLAQVASDADSHEIEKTLKLDPGLSYQLLRLVNSVAFALTTKISSYTQAITLLGRRQLQRWLQLLMYARPHGQGDDASPLMPRAAFRAGLMEGLSRRAGGDKDAQDRAFMVGMFSLLEALLGRPVAEIIGTLNLADDVTAALIRREGPLGIRLALVEAAERGPGPALGAALDAAGVDAAAWATVQTEACHWAIQISREA